MWRRVKTDVPPRGPKAEREVLSRWPLKVCYGGVICHGAKWKRWKEANPDGSMKRFYRFRARKAARAREEIRAFWARRGGVGSVQPLAAPPASEASSTSSSDTAEDVVAQREYEELLAAGASAEEILEWATHREVWDFAPCA